MTRARRSRAAKRHIVTDTQGNLLAAIVHEAGVQDRDGAPALIASACESFPSLAHLFADGGYAGEKLPRHPGKSKRPAHRNRQTPR